MAVEFATGYGTISQSGSGTNTLLGSYFELGDISFIPATVSFKGLFVRGALEAYGIAGMGIYLTNFDGYFTTTALGNFPLKDDDVVFGANFGLGANYDFTKTLFLGVEGKYMLTSQGNYETQVSGVPIRIAKDINGVVLTMLFGLRF
jgi:hypothetical protein